MIPQKLSSWGPIPGNFSRIPEELQLQEMILEKFLGNSSKKVTMVAENPGKILTFVTIGLEYVDLKFEISEVSGHLDYFGANFKDIQF